MPPRTEERDFRTQPWPEAVRLWVPRGQTRQGRAHSGPHALPGRTFLHFFPVLSAVWHSSFTGLFSVLAFCQHRRMSHCRVSGEPALPFPLKISVYFVFSSRDSGNFTSSDCFDHLIRIRTAKEGRTQDASGLLWLFFLIRNISGKKPDHWIKTVFLDIKRIQALSCV